MAIQQLEINGFRSLKQASWTPGALNLLVGPNGSGKSNLLRVLELIADTAKGRLSNYIDSQNGIVPLLWDYRPGSLSWRVRIDPVDENRDRIADALTYEVELGQVGAGSAYEIRNDTLGNWQEFSQGIANSPYWVFQRDQHHFVFYDQKQRKLADSEEGSEEIDRNESLLSQISDMRNRIPSHARRVIGGWTIHHDLHVDRFSTVRQPATTQHTTHLDADGGNLAPFLHTAYTSNREFRRLIDDGMRAGFGDEYEKLDFLPAAASQIELAVLWKSSSQPHVARDLSDGTIRYLLLLAALSNPDLPSLIAIDEPEVGLHPSMLPIIAEYAVSASERTQVILSSHSAEFLDAFSEYMPDVTVCVWEDGQTHLLSLPYNALEEWLKSYRLGQLFTRGELENLALPPVDPVSNLPELLPRLPSNDQEIG
jgi:predicted ATPase